MDRMFWIESVLSNDEASSDQELVQLFMEEGGLTQQEACQWVAKRDVYLDCGNQEITFVNTTMIVKESAIIPGYITARAKKLSRSIAHGIFIETSF